MFTQKNLVHGAVLILAGFWSLAGLTARASSATVVVGQAFTLTSSVVGTAPFTYQWYQGGTVLPGATASTYDVGNAQTINAGVYTVVISNSAGSTTSDTATITLASAPVFSTQPISQTVTAGNSVTFTAAANGLPAPTFQWKLNGVNITGATGASYVIAGVTSGDAGTYAVVATNSAGSATSTGATLAVNASVVAPIITVQPANQTVTAGAGVTFTAAANGNPAPSYQWRKNGTSIGGATGASYTILSTATGDAGTYALVATNSAGFATSTGAILTVNSMPVITTQPASQTVTAGVSVTFSTAANGSPAPTYQWRKNGVNISGATGVSYTIASATSSDASTYSVVVTNTVGSVTSAGAILTVNATNTAPTITAIAAQTTSLGTATGPINFVVGDTQTAAGSLTVGGSSSNPTLVPDGNIVFGGSGTDRTVTLTPAPGQSGTCTVTVRVSDGILTASSSFLLTVSAVASTTQTVSNSGALLIPESGPASLYPSNVTVSGLAGIISAVTVTLNNFSHAWASDVDIILVSPTGQKILLMSKAGGGSGATTNATLTFSSTAVAMLPQTGPLITGTYLPTNYGVSPTVFPAPAPAAPYETNFAGLTGQIANGTWSLYVMDGWPTDGGSMAGWSLTVTTTGAASAAPTISDILNQTTVSGTPTAAVPVTVNDVDTALVNLTLSGASSNPTLVPAGNITFGGSGANRTVTVTPAAGQTGTATITVTVSDGSLTATDSFLLSVSAPLAAPAFISQPANMAVLAGGTATFTVTASGNPSPSYQWRKNSVAISGATAATYTVANVTTTDAGTYTAVATNSVGTVTSMGAVLTVNSVPVFITQPSSQTVTTGTNVTFVSAASGSPSPSFQWRKNGVAVAGATGSSFTLTNAASADAGSYSVVATNSVGSATSSSATLTVNPLTIAPTITTQPVGKTVNAGTSATFEVVASGSPAPTYQWRKNGLTIAGATNASYALASVVASDAGTYSVVVSNSAGTVTSTGVALIVNAAKVVRADFNGDGQSDILWWNRITGACNVWLMNGRNVASTVNLGVVTTDWEIAGTGDFSGDGKCDILWQNSVTGECSIWVMNGTTTVSVVSLGVFSTDWQIAGTGDFNQDGQCDIVWQNIVSGEGSLSLMTGTTVTSNVSLGQSSGGMQIAGTGDFNNDGRCDILWQSPSTGKSTLWLMNGTNVASKVTLSSSSTSKQICGSGDFNGDGQCDILWQNNATGDFGVWNMSGTKINRSSTLGTLSTDWIMQN